MKLGSVLRRVWSGRRCISSLSALPGSVGVGSMQYSHESISSSCRVLAIEKSRTEFCDGCGWPMSIDLVEPRSNSTDLRCYHSLSPSYAPYRRQTVCPVFHPPHSQIAAAGIGTREPSPQNTRSQVDYLLSCNLPWATTHTKFDPDCKHSRHDMTQIQLRFKETV